MTWEKTKRVATVVGMASAVVGMFAVAVGVIWYFVGLEVRVRVIENQLLVIASSPAVTVDGSNTPESRTMANPIISACAEIALKAADLKARAHWTSAEEVLKLMKDLNCPLRE